MGLTGNLSTMLFADLLQWISLGLKSGTLVIIRGNDERRVYFRNGKVIASASNNPREYLSAFLISTARVDREQIRKALEAQGASKMLLGKILVMIDTISEKDLTKLMRTKAEEELYDLFLWESGEFHFTDDELPDKEMIPLQIDPTSVAMEGSRRLDEWNRARELVPTMDLVPVVENPVDHAVMSEVEGLIVQLVNGRRTLQEIVDEAQVKSYHVVVTIADLMRHGLVKLYDQEATKRRTAEKEAVQTGDEISSLLSRAQAALQAVEFDRSLRLLKAAQNLDPTNANVASALRGAETVITAELKKEGISLSRIPRVLKAFDEITSIDFSPNEAFLLSRINGIWDVASIVKISPMRESEALLILQRLSRDGIIDFAG